MAKGYISQVHPALPVKDVKKAIKFYVDNLHFSLMFVDNEESPYYAGIKRDNIELHLQWHDEKEWDKVDRISLRFIVENLQELYKEFKPEGVFHLQTKLRKTAWGTEEFAFYDLYMNGLTFYRDLI